MKKVSLLSLTVLVITFLLIAGVSANGESSLNQGTKGGQVLQYNKINNRIYWREYTTVSRAIKKNEWEDEK